MKFRSVPWKKCQTFRQAVRDKDEFKLLSGWQQWLCPTALAFFTLCHLAHNLHHLNGPYLWMSLIKRFTKPANESRVLYTTMTVVFYCLWEVTEFRYCTQGILHTGLRETHTQICSISITT